MEKTTICAARNDAVKIITDNLNYSGGVQRVSLEDALNRIAASDIYSKNTLPNKICSRWDCVFFYYDRWAAAKGDTSTWKLGKEYIYANTGVYIRGDYDTGVKVENTMIDKKGRLILLEENIQKGQNTQGVGEWLQKDELVLAANTRILPAHLNILAAAGISQVSVHRKPKVGFIATGSELVARGQYLTAGQNIESNSISIAAKCHLWGADYVSLPITIDKEERIAAALRHATNICDIVIIGGGTAKGTADHTMDIMDSIGKVFFHEVDHGPGKRTSFTLVDNKPIIGLVGPPMGEEMTFDFYVLPAIAKCLGQELPICKANCILDEDLSAHPKVGFYMPLHIYQKSDCYHAKKASSMPGSGAMILSYINGYHYLPFACDDIKAGTEISAELSPSVPIAFTASTAPPLDPRIVS